MATTIEVLKVDPNAQIHVIIIAVNSEIAKRKHNSYENYKENNW